MELINSKLEGVFAIKLDTFKDARGFFRETFNEAHYNNLGVSNKFVQDNQSSSKKNVLRGMHFQIKKPQAQLVTMISGEVFDVVVDLRKNSKTFMEWDGFYLSANATDFYQQIYMPPGFAHGFCVLSESADLHYKVSRIYDATDENGFIWNDKTININWPIRDPIINKRDQNFLKINELEASELPNIKILL